MQVGHLVFPAAIGRSGTTVFKREGDGATPVATMTFLYGYRRTDRVRETGFPLVLKPILRRDLWCDAPSHPAYNRPVRAPFAASHERMSRDDGLYDLCLVLDWNLSSRKRGAGSAIFMHLIRPGYQPTEGCVALGRRDLMRLLPHVRKGTRLTVLR